MFRMVDPSSISMTAVPSATKRMKFKDNRLGLFDDMVFYMHDFKRNYLGERWRELQVRQDILTNGGQIVSSPTDPSVTHILVPPDKEARNQDHGHSSILNLKEILNESYNTKTKEEVRVWDIPTLVLIFGEHLSENMEVIKQAEKPILRFWWIERCVRARKVLGQEEGDWGGQYIRARIFPDISRYIPDNRPIQAIDMGGQGVSKAHLDFARNMSSGGTSSVGHSARVTSAYQPRPPIDGRSQSDYDMRDDAIPPKSWARNTPTGPRAGSSTSYHDQQDKAAMPKSWNALAGALTTNKAHPRLSEPLKLLSGSSEEQSLTEPFESGRLIIRDDSPLATAEVAITMTPISSTESSHQVKIKEVSLKKRDYNTNGGQSLPSDPRPSAKRRKLQTPIEEQPIPPVMQTEGTSSTKLPRSKRDAATSPAVPAVSQISPGPLRSPRTQDQRKSSPSVKRSQSSSSSKSVTPSASATVATKPDIGRIFVTNGRPMTFSVHQGSFATEFCIKSGGGMILPVEYASTIIFIRNTTQSQHCTEEEEDILDGIELRGNWQVALSSRWVEDCLKYQSLIPEEDYKITKVPQNPNLGSMTHEQDQEQAHGAIDEAEDNDDDDDGESVIFVSDNKPALATRPVEGIARTHGIKKPGMRTMRRPESSGQKARTTPWVARQRRSTPEASSSIAGTKSTNHLPYQPRVTPPKSAEAQNQEIDDLVTLLVEEMKEWNPRKTPRTKFLTALSKKHPDRGWLNFFNRHRSKVGLRFRELGYTYPGKEGDFPDEEVEPGEVDEPGSDDEGSVWEP
ncbi:hypothetical protein I302_108521 [Kwoniella bestiolae CBS 10118]|uniref:BRCT domain-containing protein n=1 Tax=Kwoniella bestiolae CBS 10118 TaxID=1296100 RepID=A0A1B9FVH8_9TREE|nr:hypothetical protein I302_07105 [Kwoniella bestiolae CBS 10118]OCF22764.1 hypothetical protein I302_07105 [Kwoniella bestiolae CBS 10118]